MLKIPCKEDYIIMKIQDLEMMEILTIGRSIPDRIQGGLSLSLTEEFMGLENMTITKEESLYSLLDDGMGYLSVTSTVGRVSGYDVSFSSSSSMISIG
jgi:hypothetical protein